MTLLLVLLALEVLGLIEVKASIGDIITILLTDAAWTILAIIGVPYGLHELKESRKSLAWAKRQGKKRSELQFFSLNKRGATCLFYAVVVAALLGVAVIAGDLHDLLNQAEVLRIDFRRTIYRVVLISFIGAVVYCLWILKQMRLLWKRAT